MGSLQVRMVRHRSFLDVMVSGQQNLEELLRMVAGLESLTREHGDTHLLVDLQRVEGEAHVSGQMQLGEQAVKCLSHLQGVASVVPPERLTRVSESVARARRMRLKVFDSRNAALDWLLDGDPALDEDRSGIEPAHAAIWDAVRHLFPPHAQAIQLPNGTLAISWSVPRHQGSLYEMATPISVRLEPELQERLRLANGVQRQRLAAQQEEAFRAGLLGYDPCTDVPKARVIVLG